MFRKIFIFIIVLIIGINLSVFAEEEVGFLKKKWRDFLSSKQTPEKELPAKTQGANDLQADIKEKKEPTRQEMVDAIYDRIDTYGKELIDRVAGIRVKRDDEGVMKFYVEDGGLFVEIKDAGKKAVGLLYKKVMQTSAIIRAEKIQAQLNMVNRIQQLTRLNRAGSIPNVSAVNVGQRIPTVASTARSTSAVNNGQRSNIPKVVQVSKIPQLPQVPIRR